MTNPLVSVHRAFWRSVSGTVQSIRRQAPGARMIGEFAVKHVISEANKRLGGDDHTGPKPQQEPDGDAPDNASV